MPNWGDFADEIKKMADQPDDKQEGKGHEQSPTFAEGVVGKLRYDRTSRTIVGEKPDKLITDLRAWGQPTELAFRAIARIEEDAFIMEQQNDAVVEMKKETDKNLARIEELEQLHKDALSYEDSLRRELKEHTEHTEAAEAKFKRLESDDRHFNFLRLKLKAAEAKLAEYHTALKTQAIEHATEIQAWEIGMVVTDLRAKVKELEAKLAELIVAGEKMRHYTHKSLAGCVVAVTEWQALTTLQQQPNKE